MPIKNIIERIEKVTQDKVNTIIQRRKEKAEEIEREIEKEKQRRIDEIEKEREREIKTMKNRIISQAKLEAKKRKLKVREETINDIFQKAKTKLDGMKPEEYKGYLKHSIKEIDNLLDGNVKVICNKESEELVKQLVNQINSDINVEPELDTIGGIKAISERGSSIDLTFEANLERKRKDLRKEIFEILFQEEEED